MRAACLAADPCSLLTIVFRIKPKHHRRPDPYLVFVTSHNHLHHYFQHTADAKQRACLLAKEIGMRLKHSGYILGKGGQSCDGLGGGGGKTIKGASETDESGYQAYFALLGLLTVPAVQ